MAPVSHSKALGRGRAACAAAGAALVLGLAGCTPGTDEGEGGGEQAETVAAAPILEEALTDLAAYPALTATGQVAASVGEAPQDVSLTVADGGASQGTVSANDLDGELAGADGMLFLRAPEGFWLDRGVFGPDSDEFPEQWVRVTGEQAWIDPAATLAPPALAQILGGMEVASPDAVTENLDGVLTHRVDLTGERNRLWINAETGRVERVAIEELVPEGAESGPQVRLDLAEADGAAVEELYDGLSTVAGEELDSSRDARIDVTWDGQPSLSCGEGPDCTWSGVVHDQGGTGSGSVTVVMDVDFSNEELGDKECSQTGTLEAGGSLELACSVDYGFTGESGDEVYDVNAESRLSTRGLTGERQEELLTAIEEQREATLSGGAGEGGATDGTGAEPSGEATED
ncbi:hypothetical protein [Nocardiopsis sp. LOL_012]|uniref:hypothetical protein n=1 Tax=Nocardiopsis sp. LOL_012 TaxID=3345409 RepID=UPI003A8B5885